MNCAQLIDILQRRFVSKSNYCIVNENSFDHHFEGYVLCIKNNGLYNVCCIDSGEKIFDCIYDDESDACFSFLENIGLIPIVNLDFYVKNRNLSKLSYTRLTFNAQGLVMFIRWYINENPVYFHKINVYNVKCNEYTDQYNKLDEIIINKPNTIETREIICKLAENNKDMFFEVWNDGY